MNIYLVVSKILYILKHNNWLPNQLWQVYTCKYGLFQLPGYSTEFLPGILDRFSYPNGSEWQQMIKNGIFPPADEVELVNI